MAIDWQSRRDGFEHRTDKPTDRPINWKYWASLPALRQWEACALSVNVNPDNLKAKRMVIPGMPAFLPESFPSSSVELEFDRRLTMFNRYAGGNHLAEVRPQWFAGWCGHVGLENLPPELVAMATPEPKAAPVAMPEPTVAPVVAVSALGGVDHTPDPERRLVLLRALGGSSKYARGEWTFKGMAALVASEKANGFKRCDEKTIRADLKEAAQAEREAKSAGIFNGLGQR